MSYLSLTYPHIAEYRFIVTTPFFSWRSPRRNICALMRSRDEYNQKVTTESTTVRVPGDGGGYLIERWFTRDIRYFVVLCCTALLRH